MKSQEIDIKSLSNQLEDLIDVTGDSCGPLLIKELQLRIAKTVDRFNRDLDGLLKESFKNHKDRIKLCKKIINDKSLVAKLFDEVAPKYEERQGGYTRIIRVGSRRGDGSEIAVFELV